MRAVLNISFGLSKVPSNKMIEEAIGMSPADLPFSFGYECQEHLWFDSQTTSTITFVLFLQAENRSLIFWKKQVGHFTQHFLRSIGRDIWLRLNF